MVSITKAKIVLNDIIHLVELTREMEHQSLYILDNRKLIEKGSAEYREESQSFLSSNGSMPYPNNIFSSYPYQWIVVFNKKGRRSPVKQHLLEQSKISQQDWDEWVKNPIWELPEPEPGDIYYNSVPYHIDLPYRLIKLYSYAGDTVFVPFTGTGVTALAAKKLGRSFLGYKCFGIKDIRRKLTEV